MDTLSYVILVPMVYLAFGVFIIGMAYRIMTIVKRPALPIPLNIYPEKKNIWVSTLVDTFLLPTLFRIKPVMWFFLFIFHICVLLLIIGHIELFKPFAMFQIIPHDIFIGKGMVGLLMLICVLYFFYRRFTPAAKHLSVLEDYILLILLLLTIVMGSQMDWARTWFDFQEMTTDDYQTYLLSLLVFKPEISSVTYSGHSFMLVFHIFFANLFIMLFPFSKMMHAIFTIPLNKIRRG